jgi:hypothetical protein
MGYQTRCCQELCCHAESTVEAVDMVYVKCPQVDLVTPMCTQLTYEGLIDEVFGIKNGVVQLELGGDGVAHFALLAGCMHVRAGDCGLHRL